MLVLDIAPVRLIVRLSKDWGRGQTKLTHLPDCRTSRSLSALCSILAMLSRSRFFEHLDILKNISTSDRKAYGVVNFVQNRRSLYIGKSSKLCNKCQAFQVKTTLFGRDLVSVMWGYFKPKSCSFQGGSSFLLVLH